jgi:predicted nuclease of predicted toxin-antitoxin system
MDVHVPAAVRLRGVDVVTAQEDGRELAADPYLLDRATELGRVVVTMDEDFLAAATRRQRAGIRFGGVIYAHQHEVTLGRLSTTWS